MSTFVKSDPKQSELSSQSGQAIFATSDVLIEEMRHFGNDRLLKWIRQKEPDLISGDDIEKFKAKRITGRAFLNHAGDKKFFQVYCELPPVLSDDLADLASEIVGRKSKYYHLHHTLHATAS